VCAHTVAGDDLCAARYLRQQQQQPFMCALAQLNSDNRPRKSLPARTDCTPILTATAVIYLCCDFQETRRTRSSDCAVIYSGRLRLLLHGAQVTEGKSVDRRNKGISGHRNSSVFLKYVAVILFYLNLIGNYTILKPRISQPP
jgi:hypothetical protein